MMKSQHGEIAPNQLGLGEAIHLDSLSQGIVTFNDEIDGISAQGLMQDIAYAIRLGNKSIRLYINSHGGAIGSAFAMYDFIREQINAYQENRGGAMIGGIVRGTAESAASMILLQACEPRVATDHSRLHLHEPSAWNFGPVALSSMKDNAEELSKLEGIVLGIVARRAGKHYDIVKDQLSRRETWMSAHEAKDWGLIDGVQADVR